MLNTRSKDFFRLVSGLKDRSKTCTVVESCCGGLISASLMSIPGSSAVFYGGSVAYNTKRAKKLLLDDTALHKTLTSPMDKKVGESEGDAYIRSKLRWTAETAIEFCKQMDVDYAIAEGGASGPTFRPEGLDKGFAVIAIAGRRRQEDFSTVQGQCQQGCDDGDVELLAQKVIHSTHANREANMRLFADAAAQLAVETIGLGETEEKPKRKTWKQEEKKSPSSSASLSWLDRASRLRSNEDLIRELEERKDAKHVILRNANECLFTSPTKLSLLSQEELFELSNTAISTTKTFLGLDNNQVPIFAVEITNADNDEPSSSFELSTNTSFLNTRSHAPLLSSNENELALYATAMAQWKKSHKFCTSCGKPTIPIHGGTCLQCIGCRSLSWPRQDPSIIVLITNQQGDKALLARSSRHPMKFHTALAGFVEAGETFERSVTREVFEETGVHVDLDSIQYLSSQPWPFPRSVMVGFRATANDSKPLKIDFKELVAADWFDKTAVKEAAKVLGPVLQEDVAKEALEQNPSLELLIPPQGVLARCLIDNWLIDESQS